MRRLLQACSELNIPPSFARKQLEQLDGHIARLQEQQARGWESATCWWLPPALLACCLRCHCPRTCAAARLSCRPPSAHALQFSLEGAATLALVLEAMRTMDAASKWAAGGLDIDEVAELKNDVAERIDYVNQVCG